MVPVSNKLDSFFPSTSTSSTASYKSLPQTPSEAVELGVEELELDIGISSRDLDLQNRHQRQPLLVHQTSQYHRPGSHYPAGLHTLFEEDVKEDEEQRMAAYDPQNDNHFLGTSSEAELVSVPVKEERKGDKLALYIALVSIETFNLKYFKTRSHKPPLHISPRMVESDVILMWLRMRRAIVFFFDDF